jgi:hypothetical protein
MHLYSPSYDDADDDEIDRLKDLVNVDKILKGIETCDRGVSVQASTLGSLEALLAFLRDCKPPSMPQLQALMTGPLAMSRW